MRNSKTEPLKKTELAKAAVKKCSTMASQRIITCKKCGYLNGMVEKVGTQIGIGISHDRSEIHGGEVDECKTAISHKKESSGAINNAHGLLKAMSGKNVITGESNKSTI